MNKLTDGRRTPSDGNTSGELIKNGHVKSETLTSTPEEHFKIIFSKY
jgi:hypothetical protein